MKSSCITTPQSSRYIQVHEWQLIFCQGNHCAAFLLSHFMGWHDWKLQHDEYYARANDIAEAHGDERPHNQNAYLFFTMEELVDSILNLYGKNSVAQALQLLVTLKVISIHKNPNARYHFDKTKYFLFYPDVCNEWLAARALKEKLGQDPLTSKKKNKPTLDCLKVNDRVTKSNALSLKNKSLSLKKGQAITNTTNKKLINNLTKAKKEKEEKKREEEKHVFNRVSVNDESQITFKQEEARAKQFLNSPLSKTKQAKTYSQARKPIEPHFYPNQHTIKLALLEGLGEVTNPAAIQQFIDYNQQRKSQWEDFNPLYLRWLKQAKTYAAQNTVKFTSRRINDVTNKPRRLSYDETLDLVRANNPQGWAMVELEQAADCVVWEDTGEESYGMAMDETDHSLWPVISDAVWEAR